MIPILKVLYIEDSEEDAGLVMRELRKNDNDFIFKIVDNKKDFELALTDFAPDLILSDHSLPGFNSLEALKICKAHALHIPFVLVTGAVSEEFAVEILQQGADDYILKDKLTRLPSAITQAINKRSHEAEKKRMEAMLVSRNEELKKLSHYLNQVREDERKQVSLEVHDQLGQLASAIKIDADWLQMNIGGSDARSDVRIDRIRASSTLMIETVRNIAIALRPSIIDELGINETLRWHCSEFQRMHNIACVFKEEFDDTHTSSKIRTELFRIYQECTTNILRHAGASEISVHIFNSIEGIQLKISDNGKGFDSNQKMTNLGLILMTERAVSIGGKLTVSSEPGKGTTISVIIPHDA